jgi:hypothetical protein
MLLICKIYEVTTFCLLVVTCSKLQRTPESTHKIDHKICFRRLLFFLSRIVSPHVPSRLAATPSWSAALPSRLQANNTTKTLSSGPVGRVYPPFYKGLQTAWFVTKFFF